MLDKMIALLERFVAAHESIANSLANTATTSAGEIAIKEVKHVAEETPAVEEKVEETPEPKTRRTRTTKTKEEPAVDVKALRDEVLEIDDALTDGDIEEALDEFDDLMDEYKAKTLKDIKEADLPEFVKKARKIVAKYYNEK